MVPNYSYMFGMDKYLFVSKEIIESVGYSDENAKSRRAVAEKSGFYGNFKNSYLLIRKSVLTPVRSVGKLTRGSF